MDVDPTQIPAQPDRIAETIVDTLIPPKLTMMSIAGPVPGLDRDPRLADAGEYRFLRSVGSPDEPRRLGRYEILRLLGRGGMGMVFLAFDPRLSRHVAIKLLVPNLSEEPLARHRFEREARSMAAIRHEHVLPIFDVHSGDSGGPPYFVMPLVEGASLQDRLEKEGRFPPAEILRIGREMALGLIAIHAHSMIHRDLKPANVLLEGIDQRVRIADFGLVTTRKVRVDNPVGIFIGTPGFAAPEQICGPAVTPRTDLFSLGCVLYALATGRGPFQAEAIPQLMNATMISRHTPVVELDSSFPKDLSDWIDRLLEKEPDRRPESAEVVAEAFAVHSITTAASDRAFATNPLEAAEAPVEQLEPSTDRAPSSKASSRLAAAAWILLAVALGAAIYAIRMSLAKS